MLLVIIRNPESGHKFLCSRVNGGIITMTYEVAFKKLKEKFANVDSSKLADMAIQFTLSDEDCGGTFYAEVRNGVIAVEPYDYKDNDAVVDVTRAALTKILDSKLTVEKAVEKGDLTVKGDLEKIKSVADAIVAPVKKPAVKKAAAKTTAAKKAPAKTETKTTAAKTTKTAAKKAEAPAKAEAKTATKTAAKKTTATKAPAAKKTTK